jgi:hypothetical protein
MSSTNTRAPVVVSLAWDFRRLMVDHVAIEHKIGQNEHGEAAFAAPIQAFCAVEYVTREIRTKDGRTRIASTRITLDGLYGTTPEDRLTLSDGRQPVILEVNRLVDEIGPSFEVISTGTGRGAVGI